MRFTPQEVQKAILRARRELGFKTPVRPRVRSVFYDEEGDFLGVVWVNDIRHIVFERDLYDKVKVSDLMFMPRPTVSPQESMEDIAHKFENSNHYNLPVVENGKYVGFVSRANVFSKYRELVKHFSED